MSLIDTFGKSFMYSLAGSFAVQMNYGMYEMLGKERFPEIWTPAQVVSGIMGAPCAYMETAHKDFSLSTKTVQVIGSVLGAAVGSVGMYMLDNNLRPAPEVIIHGLAMAALSATFTNIFMGVGLLVENFRDNGPPIPVIHAPMMEENQENG